MKKRESLILKMAGKIVKAEAEKNECRLTAAMCGLFTPAQKTG